MVCLCTAIRKLFTGTVRFGGGHKVISSNDFKADWRFMGPLRSEGGGYGGTRAQP